MIKRLIIEHNLPVFGTDDEDTINSLGLIELTNNNPRQPLNIRPEYCAFLSLKEIVEGIEFIITVTFFNENSAEVGSVEFEERIQFRKTTGGYQFPNMNAWTLAQLSIHSLLIELMKASGSRLEIDIGEGTLHLHSVIINRPELIVNIPKSLFTKILH